MAKAAASGLGSGDSGLNRPIQLVATILIAHAIALGGRVVVDGRAAASGGWLDRAENSPAATQARELPIQHYTKLKRAALSSANGRLGPRMRNPRVARTGLDVEVSMILDEQGKYLRNSGEFKWKETQTPRLKHGPVPVGILSRAKFPLRSCLTPVVATISGRAVGAVFTPRLGDNHIRIEGCGFGREAGEVHLMPASSLDSLEAPIRTIALQLEGSSAWSETEIDVRLDPRLAGLPDFTTTLVIRLADGREVKVEGCRFVAARGEPVPLKTVPASWVKLSATTATSGPIHELEYLSPPAHGAEVPSAALGMSALVIRSDPDAFAGGTDVYDFSALNPGWIVESVQVQRYSIDCPGDVTRASQYGNWSTRLDAHGFTLRWTNSTCLSFIPPMFRFSMNWSEYAVKVWVVGPIGTEPIGATALRTEVSSN
jgi:hypothetical protein